MGIDPEALASFHDSSFYCEVVEPAGADSAQYQQVGRLWGMETITTGLSPDYWIIQGKAAGLIFIIK